jgi:hypothetical protein
MSLGSCQKNSEQLSLYGQSRASCYIPFSFLPHPHLTAPDRQLRDRFPCLNKRVNNYFTQLHTRLLTCPHSSSLHWAETYNIELSTVLFQVRYCYVSAKITKPCSIFRCPIHLCLCSLQAHSYFSGIISWLFRKYITTETDFKIGDIVKLWGERFTIIN